MEARIYQPVKNPLQSGRANAGRWLLEFDQTSARRLDGLMGWTGTTDTDTQLKMKFESREAAEAFAQKQGISYRVVEPKKRIVKPKSYSDNFAYDRLR